MTEEKNCHSALTPCHESVHKGEVGQRAFVAMAFERGEWCDLLVLEHNVIHLSVDTFAVVSTDESILRGVLQLPYSCKTSLSISTLNPVG